MRLKTASKSLKGKRLRLLVPLILNDGTWFGINEIVTVVKLWRRTVHVVAAEPIRHACGIPIHYFELAEDPGPTPAKAPPPANQKRTWVRGVLLISLSGAVSVGGALLSDVFAEFNGKNVRVTLEVKG